MHKKCEQCNKENVRKRSVFCCDKCKRISYVIKNKDKICEYKKQYRKKNAKKIKKYHADRYQKNKEDIKDRNKEYSKQNPTYKMEYDRRRYKDDIQFKLTDILRSRLYKAMKNNQKTGSAVKDLGCTIKELKQHIEQQFQPGMSWNNWAIDGWHIDHIKPLSSFDLSNSEEFKKACHYSNLQPLWAKDNLSKNNKVI